MSDVLGATRYLAYYLELAMTCWLINTTRENYDITRERGFDLIGIDAPNSRKASQMVSGDRIVFYVRDDRSFAAAATVTAKVLHDSSPIWKHHTKKEKFRNRVPIEPDVIVDDGDWVDALQVGPTMEYVKRWPPEMWELAFFGMVHIISKRDFELLENELNRYADDAEYDDELEYETDRGDEQEDEEAVEVGVTD